MLTLTKVDVESVGAMKVHTYFSMYEASSNSGVTRKQHGLVWSPYEHDYRLTHFFFFF